MLSVQSAFHRATCRKIESRNDGIPVWGWGKSGVTVRDLEGA